MKLRLWEDRAPGARGDAESDIPVLDAYLVPGEQVPAVIVCPGGGYNHLAEHEAEPIAVWLNGLGLSAFVLRYRTAPYQPDAAFLDAGRAVRLLRHRASELRIDANRIGMIGFSAGGHLTALAGTRGDDGDPQAIDPVDRHSSRLQAMILSYAFISVDRDGSEAAWVPEAFKPDRQVTADTPPAFIWHTAEDEKVSAANSLRMADALGRAGAAYSLHIFPRGHHGLQLAADHPECAAWTGLCADWLRAQGFTS